MADWWDNSRNRYESGSASSSSGLSNIGNFGWQNDIADIKSRTSYDDSDNQSVTGSSGGIFQDTQKLHGQDHPTSVGGGNMVDPNLHMMGLGLSSQALDWNHQALLRGEKAERGYSSMIQENTNFQEGHAGMVPSLVQWREKLFPQGSSSDSSMSHEFKNINRGFSLDQTQFVCPPSNSSEITSTCQGLPLIDSSTTMFHGFLGSENQPQQHSMNFPYQVANYGMNSTNDQLLHPSLSKSVPQFLRNSPPKMQPHHGQFHFPSNTTTPYWNASAASMNDHIRPSFLSSLQTQFSPPNFEEKPKNLSGNVGETCGAMNVMKKSGSETAASKRPRNEGPSPLPAFKVRKEKMGDRVTALQQLVSPFGKTDTASVLSEAIEYIKFLHEQVGVLSTPYLKSAPPLQQHQSSEQSKEPEGQNQDLRSRGLCLVPISSTFPVTHETTVDFWTPTFGGTYR